MAIASAAASSSRLPAIGASPIARRATRLGFPEVKLGIFPGLNGTVRSIQLAGPMDAMTAMLTGRMLRPTAAKAIGLVDQLVPTHHNLRWAARKAVLQKRRSKGAPWWKQLMLKQPVRGCSPSRCAPRRPRRCARSITRRRSA